MYGLSLNNHTLNSCKSIKSQLLPEFVRVLHWDPKKFIYLIYSNNLISSFLLFSHFFIPASPSSRYACCSISVLHTCYSTISFILVQQTFLHSCFIPFQSLLYSCFSINTSFLPSRFTVEMTHPASPAIPQLIKLTHREGLGGGGDIIRGWPCRIYKK